MNDLFLQSFFDEMEKIAASSRAAKFNKSRKGVRPIGVTKILEKESSFAPGEEGHVGGMLKKAEKDHHPVMERFVAARPYVSSAVKAALPTATLGALYGGPTHGAKAARVMGAIGASLGLANEGIKSWAEGHKRKDDFAKLVSNVGV
jgi:hypothetical protein